MTISFFAQGSPKGQPRPRAFAMKFGNKYQARVYDSGTAEGWKGCIAVAAKDFIPAQPLEFPIRLTLIFYMPRPKSHFAKDGTIKPTAPSWFTSKPDNDNLEKAVCDSLTVLGMWKDDSYVVKSTTVKAYANGKTGCDIIIEDITEIDHVAQKHWNDSTVASLL